MPYIGLGAAPSGPLTGRSMTMGLFLGLYLLSHMAALTYMVAPSVHIPYPVQRTMVVSIKYKHAQPARLNRGGIVKCNPPGTRLFVLRTRHFGPNRAVFSC